MCTLLLGIIILPIYYQRHVYRLPYLLLVIAS